MMIPRLRAYILIAKRTLDEYAAYRLNFVMWRVRMVMHLLVVFFLWNALFTARNEYFGYTQSMMFSYVLLSGIVRSVVLGTTTNDVSRLINQGDLSNYLLKPFPFFRYYVARDAADKSLNAAFAVVELIMVYLIFRPPVFIQTDPVVLLLTGAALALGMILYFAFSMTLGLFGFWLTDVWSLIFLMHVVTEFFAGGLFPLDILPPSVFAVSAMLPFFYFIFFPLKVYLGQIPYQEIAQGFLVGGAWAVILTVFMHMVWRKGLRAYTAEGR